MYMTKSLYQKNVDFCQGVFGYGLRWLVFIRPETGFWFVSRARIMGFHRAERVRRYGQGIRGPVFHRVRQIQHGLYFLLLDYLLLTIQRCDVFGR